MKHGSFNTYTAIKTRTLPSFSIDLTTSCGVGGIDAHGLKIGFLSCSHAILKQSPFISAPLPYLMQEKQAQSFTTFLYNKRDSLLINGLVPLPMAPSLAPLDPVEGHSYFRVRGSSKMLLTYLLTWGLAYIPGSLEKEQFDALSIEHQQLLFSHEQAVCERERES